MRFLHPVDVQDEVGGLLQIGDFHAEILVHPILLPHEEDSLDYLPCELLRRWNEPDFHLRLIRRLLQVELGDLLLGDPAKLIPESRLPNPCLSDLLTH
jgi:hypothetical protein